MKNIFIFGLKMAKFLVKNWFKNCYIFGLENGLFSVTKLIIFLVKK